MSEERIGCYRIVRPLSKGGMALVYEAVRETMGGVAPRVALKVILPEHAHSESYRDLFINEARLGAWMEHRNLLKVWGFQKEKGEKGRHYLVMEYLEGLNLRRVLSRCEQHGVEVPPKVIAEIGRQACDGLDFAHQALDGRGKALNLVHRDMKPSNLMLTPHGVIKVLDFGISKGVLSKERKGSVKGTWGYMAPEQALGKLVKPATDVFGLAIVLYELASKRPMFRDKPKDEIRRLLQDDHAARMVATLGPSHRALVSVLVRALQVDPNGRYVTAREFGADLGVIAGDSYHAGQDLRAFYDRVCDLETEAPPPPAAPAGGGAPAPEPIPARPVERPGQRPVGRVGGSTVGLGLVGALGVLGVVAGSVWALGGLFASMGWLESTDSLEEPVAVEREVRSDPIVVPVQSPEPLPDLEPLGPNAGPQDGEEAQAQDPADHARVTFEVRPSGEVYIEGQYGGASPYEAWLPAGTFSVELMADDGRWKRFQVTVKEGDDRYVVRVVDPDSGKGRKTSLVGWDFDRRERVR